MTIVSTGRMLSRREAPGHEYGWYVPDEPLSTSRGDDRRTWLSVDLVAITDDPHNPALVLYRRERDPHAGELTLPGAVMDPAKGQTVAETAAWIAAERAHAQVVPGTEPFPISVVSDPTRDERGHTVSLVCLARVGQPGSEAVRITADDTVPQQMPFGHAGMLTAAVRRAFDAVLTDPAVARALVSADPQRGITGTGLFTTLRLLHHLSGGGLADAPTAEAVRRRRSRSPVLIPTDTTAPAKTRPETVLVSASLG